VDIHGRLPQGGGDTWRRMSKPFTFRVCAALLLSTSAMPALPFRAAIAVKTVTPDPLLPVSGGVGPSKPVKDKAGDLKVRALVLQSGDTRVAIVTGDFLGFPAALGDRVRAAVTNIPGTNILIAATHTHSAPDCYGFPNTKGGTDSDPKYLQLVCARMADAINEATASVQPATLRIATGEAKGKIAYNYYAPDLYDPRCHILQFLKADGSPLATLVNYAIHPEILGSEAGLCSPDLIGPLCDRISEHGGGTGIFLNSAQGGMVTADNRSPQNGEARSWAECERIGNLLADEALRIVNSSPVQKDPSLACYSRSISFPMDSPLFRSLLQRTGSAAKEVTTKLNVINLGNAQILTIPGEALPNIGFYLKRKMRGEHNLLFGLTNDAYGYILTREDFNSFKRYQYVSRTSLGENTGEILVNEALKFVNELPSPAPLARN
jgi:hypothetical protein